MNALSGRLTRTAGYRGIIHRIIEDAFNYLLARLSDETTPEVAAAIASRQSRRGGNG